MDNYKKYLKYKNKYNDLKKKIIVGGEILERNYYLHARLPKEIENIFEKVQNNIYMLKKYESYMKLKSDGTIMKETMPAHITLCYGPKIKYEESEELLKKEISEKSEFGKIYPNFEENFKKLKPKVIYKNITPYLREDKIVIKVELESKILTEMVKYCRKTIESFNDTILLWKKSYLENREVIKEKYPKLFREDESFDEENPIGFLHITIVTLKAETPEKIIISIIKKVEKSILKLGIKRGDELKIDRIDIKTPITRKFIDIYKIG